MISKLHSYQSVSSFLNININLFAKYERIVLKKVADNSWRGLFFFFCLEINPCPPFLLNSIRKTPTTNYEMRCWKVWCSIFLHYCCHSHARKGFAFFASFSKKYWRDVIISFISGVSFQHLNRYSEWMVLLDLRFFLQSESFLPCILNLNFSCMISWTLFFFCYHTHFDSSAFMFKVFIWAFLYESVSHAILYFLFVNL